MPTGLEEGKRRVGGADAVIIIIPVIENNTLYMEIRAANSAAR